MKKVLSMLVVFTLIIGMTFSVSAKATNLASQTVEKTGVIKAFNETSIAVIEDGKAQGYAIAKDAKIIKNGEAVNLLEVAQKGMKVKYKVVITNGKPSYINYLEIPNSGSIYEGIPGTSMSNEVNTTIAYQETAVSKITKNSNSMIEASSLTVNKEKEADYDTFDIQSKNSVIYIGTVVIVPNSVKLTIDGKDIKIIDGKAEFDKTAANDEAKLTLAEKTGVYTLVLEAPLTEAQVKDRDNAIKLAYKTKEYDIQRLEMSDLLVNEDVYCELNGKEVSYAKAMFRGNYAAFTTNGFLEIIYVDAYYKNLEATVSKISGNSITINVLKGGRVAYTETLAIDPGCTIDNTAGEELSLSDVKVGGKILISTLPSLGYKISEITIVQ